MSKQAMGTITPDEDKRLDKLIEATGFMTRNKKAQGGIANARTGLQWGSDKGEGLGGEEAKQVAKEATKETKEETPKEESEEVKTKLEEAGATVTLK